MDFRLEPAIHGYLEEKGFSGDCDVISIAGAAKDLVDDSNGFLANQIDLSVQLHSISSIILMNHTDCGGYGGSSKHEHSDAEYTFHIGQLHQAKSVLNDKYPDLSVQLALAAINNERVDIQEVA